MEEPTKFFDVQRSRAWVITRRSHTSHHRGQQMAMLRMLGRDLHSNYGPKADTGGFFPQFVVGYLGMPRRYWRYPPEFQVYNVLSTAGASSLAIGYLLPIVYLLWSLRYGKVAPDNPWQATGLEWRTASPPQRSTLRRSR